MKRLDMHPAALRAGTAALLLAGSSLAHAAAPGREPATGLLLTGSLDAEYDSNQLRTNRSALSNPNAHVDDIHYSPAIEAVYNRNSGKISLTATGVIGRDIFQRNSYLDRNRYIGGGTLTYHAGTSCRASLNGNYARRQSGIRGANDPLDDPNFVPDDVGRVIDNVQTSSIYGVNAGCGTPSGRLSFGGGYSHSSLSNAAPTRRFGDSEGDTFTGNVGIGILRPGQLSLNGSYSTIAYPGRVATGGLFNLPPQLLNSGVKTYRIGVSFSRPIGTRLSGTIGASFLHAEPSGGQAPYSSPAYNLGLTYTASRRLTVTLNGSRDIIASTSAGALYRVVDQVSLESHYSFGRAITFDANAGLIRNDYKQPFSIPGEVARQKETTKTFGVGVTYAPRPLYDARLFVSHTVRDSDPSIFNYSSTKASIRLAIHI